MRRLTIQVLWMVLWLGTNSVSSAASFHSFDDYFGDHRFLTELVIGGLSKDGSVLVGTRGSSAGGGINTYELFRWSRTGGVELLGRPVNDAFAVGADVTPDGHIIGGYGDATEGFRWLPNTGFQSIGTIPGFAQSRAYAISADGNALAGEAYNISGPNRRRVPVRWTADGGIENLGFLPGGNVGQAPTAGATDISHDGEVVVGYSNSSNSGFPVRQAFRWTESGGMAGLGFLPNSLGPERQGSDAQLVSGDGDVVVGSSNVTLGTEGFRWTQQGGMLGIGRLPGAFDSFPTSMSAAGDVIVGTSEQPVGQRAFFWDTAHGIRDLRQVLIDDYGLADQVAGWQLTAVQHISGDGNLIIGGGVNPLGQFDGWVAVIPEPSSLALAAVGLAAIALRHRTRRGGA
jgi:probable HAF family extracellular repeat protein